MNPRQRWLLTIGTLAVALAVGAGGAALPGLDQYDVFQYINLQGPSPAKIARLDTNGQVLFACRHASSRDAIRAAGVAFSESQIQLLKIMGLLSEHDGLLTTTFPILQPTDTSRLRAATAEASAAMLDQVEPFVTSLKSALDSDFNSEHAFAIVFSYVLDGLVWQQLNPMVQSPGPPSAESSNPFWSGQLWAISPKRNDTVGTTTDYKDGYMLYVVWSPQAKGVLAPIYESGVDAHLLLSQIAANGRVTDAVTRAAYSAVGILNPNGKPLVPIISRQPDNPLQQACQHLADAVVSGTTAHLDFQRLADGFDLGDPHTAMIVSYHELMWDLLALLQQRGILTRPAVLTSPPADDSKSCADIAFIVRDTAGY
jgi:hypothetical protein